MSRVLPPRRVVVFQLFGSEVFVLSDVVEASDFSPSSFILSLGGQFCTPSKEKWLPVHASPYEKWEAAHQLPSMPYELSLQERKERPSAERDWVLGMLRDVVGLKGLKWESLGDKGWWRWRAALRREIQHVDEIEDNSYRLDRELTFFSCGSWRSNGRHIKYEDGSRRLAAYSCSERACPKCYDRDKKRTARKFFKQIMAAAKALGLKRFWGIEITLPPEYEAMPVNQALIEAIQKYLRKLFGLKTRDGLFSYCNVHSVGNKNIFRDRFHFHCGVLPVATRCKKGQRVELIRCDFKTFKADLDRARSLLADHLEDVLPRYDRSKTNVYLAPFLLKEDNKSMGKLMHHLKYDLRGFGKDIEQAPVCFNLEHKLAVINQGDLGYGVFTFRQIVDRWKWIREQRCLRTWGLLKTWNKYLDHLDLEYVPDPEPEIAEEKEVTIIRSGGRQWNPKKKRVEWVSEKMAIDENGQVIHGVEWGRKGSEGDWKPKAGGKGAEAPRLAPSPPRRGERRSGIG